MPYVTRQTVLQLAGLWFRELSEVPEGLVNSSNARFFVAHKPLSDNDYNDTVSIADVSVRVNGVTAVVASLNATTGEIVMNTAPTTGAQILIDYSYQSVPAGYVDDAISEASATIDLALTSFETVPFTGTVPVVIKKICRFYAAGLLMSGEYGLQRTDEEVKEGERKIKLAERWLKDYVTIRKANLDDTRTSSVGRANADVRLFQTYNESEGRWENQSDEQFSEQRTF